MASSTTKRSTSARSKGASRPKSAGNGSSTPKRSAATARRAKSGVSQTSASKNRSSSSARNGVVRNVAGKAKTPLLAGGAAVAGLVGGLVLASRGNAPRKRVLGLPVANKGLDFKPVAKEIQKAGKQLGRFADEIAQAREQARKVGDALS